MPMQCRRLWTAALADSVVASDGSGLRGAVVPYEVDAVTRLIVDTHDAAALAPDGHRTSRVRRVWVRG
jgi:ethanolamine ammonia-lyase large subunit